MPRLPAPGGDDGTWGQILNAFLTAEHNADGSHLEASATVKGPVRLAGDLGGTPDSPTVPGLADKAEPRGPWAATTAYRLNDIVLNSGGIFRCTSAHTSTGTFDPSKWEQWSPVSNTFLPLTGGTVTGSLNISTATAGSASQLLINDTGSNPGITLNSDTNLFRSGIGQLQTSSTLFIVRGTLGVAGLGVTTSGDTTRRFQVNTDGKMLWSAGGSGSPPQDTTLVREASGGLKLQNSAGTTATPATPALTIEASVAGVASGSPSTGGAALIKMGNNPGSGLNIHAARSNAAVGRLVNIIETGADSPQAALHVGYAGTANGVEIDYSGTGANGSTGPGTGQALNVVSTNPHDTAVGVSGQELARGTLKVVHTIPSGQAAGADSSASALSVRVNGAGTAAQGLFIDSDTGGTTGNLLTIRNGGFANQRLTLNADGDAMVAQSIQVGSGTALDTGNGTGVIGLKQATAIPNANPAAGGVVIFADNGALKVRGSDGVVTTVGSGSSSDDITYGDCGLLGWSLDPATASSNHALTSGVIALAKVKTSGGTISSIGAYVNVAGSGLTSGQCFAALYSAGGTLLGVTANQSTAWASVGQKAMNLTSPATGVSSGFVYVAFLANGTTAPAFSCGAKTAAVNVGMSAGSYRFATIGSGQTSMPSSLTMTSQAQLSAALVALLS